MKTKLLLFLACCAVSTLSFAQGSDCTTASIIATNGTSNGDLTGITNQYWYINPTTSGTVNVNIGSASNCGIVLDIVAFSTLQTGACVPGGAGADGRIVSNWNSCGGGSTSSTIALTVTAGQYYYFKVSRFFIGSGEPYSITISGLSILPIELQYQKVQQQANAAILEWSTVQEINNSHFVIERSATGRDFQAIGKVMGNLTAYTVSNYEFKDKQPLADNYYRLVQYDLDGHFEILPILHLRLQKETGELTAYFAANQLMLQIDTETASNTPLYIVNTMGQILYQQEVRLEKGKNEWSLQNMSQLPAGIYFVLLDMKDGQRQVAFRTE